MDELSLFFPAFNEEENLADTLDAASRAAEKLGLARYELIVVDDGSTDRTRAIAESISRDDPHVRVVHHPRNAGYGAALKTGFAAASYEWVFWSDSDGQFDLTELERLVPFTSDFDAIIGYRVDRADNTLRKLNTYMWNLLIRLVFGLRVHDVDCAFKLVRRSCLEQVAPLECEGALLSTELLVRLEQHAFSIKEVGVSHLPRRAGSPSGADPKVIAKAFAELARQRKSIGTARAGRKPACSVSTQWGRAGGKAFGLPRRR